MPTMAELLDFLSFRSYVSPYALLAFYYLGAVLMPLALVFFWFWLKRRFPELDVAQRQGDNLGKNHLSPMQRAGLLLACVFCFLFAELFWRMMFEFVIAYFHMVTDIQSLAQ